MTRKRQNSNNDFDQAHFIKLTKRRFKKKFKKEITATEINKIWKDFVQYGIIQNVLKGNCTKIDKHSTIQVIGEKIEEDSRFVKLLKQGLIVRQTGDIKKVLSRGVRNDFKYKIVYKNKLAKGKLIFNASADFKRQLVKTLNTTNNYFQIESNVNK
jgi:hypothetical protein